MFVSSPMVHVVVDVIADVVDVVAGNAVAIGLVGANAATHVEGIVVVIVGMTVRGALSRLACLR